MEFDAESSSTRSRTATTRFGDVDQNLDHYFIEELDEQNVVEGEAIAEVENAELADVLLGVSNSISELKAAQNKWAQELAKIALNQEEILRQQVILFETIRQTQSEPTARPELDFDFPFHTHMSVMKFETDLAGVAFKKNVVN